MISFSISCEASEIPAARQLLAGLLALDSPPGNLRDRNHKVTTKQLPEVKSETPKEPYQCGSYPANFEEAPIEFSSNVSNALESEKIKFTADVRAKILEMAAKGTQPTEIATALGIPDARRVQGVILGEARRKARQKMAQEQVPKEPTNPRHARILELDRQKLTPHSISDALEEETGEVVSESEIMDVIVKVAKGMP